MRIEELLRQRITADHSRKLHFIQDSELRSEALVRASRPFRPQDPELKLRMLRRNVGEGAQEPVHAVLGVVRRAAIGDARRAGLPRQPGEPGFADRHRDLVDALRRDAGFLEQLLQGAGDAEDAGEATEVPRIRAAVMDLRMFIQLQIRLEPHQGGKPQDQALEPRAVGIEDEFVAPAGAAQQIDREAEGVGGLDELAGNGISRQARRASQIAIGVAVELAAGGGVAERMGRVFEPVDAEHLAALPQVHEALRVAPDALRGGQAAGEGLCGDDVDHASFGRFRVGRGRRRWCRFLRSTGCSRCR